MLMSLRLRSFYTAEIPHKIFHFQLVCKTMYSLICTHINTKQPQKIDVA